MIKTWLGWKNEQKKLDGWKDDNLFWPIKKLGDGRMGNWLSR